MKLFAVLFSVIAAGSGYNLQVNEDAEGAARYCTDSICNACSYASDASSPLGAFCSAFMAQIGNECCSEGSGY